MTLEAATAIAAMAEAIRRLEADSGALIEWHVGNDRAHRTLDVRVLIYLRGHIDHLPIGGTAAVTMD